MTLPTAIIRYTEVSEPETVGDAAASRTRRFKISDSTVARDGHTLATKGWLLDNFRKNPIVLAVHDAEHIESVIGRATIPPPVGDDLYADIEFAPADINPLAEMTLRMVDGKWLRATSVGFIPIEGKPARGRGNGAYDFSSQELLEISIVPVGSLPDALAAARAAGIDTTPALDWARRIVESAKMTTTPEAPKPAPAQRAPRAVMKRDLFDVANLAYLMWELGWLHDGVVEESAREGDDSGVPAMLAVAMNQLGAVLVAMTAEETAELLNGRETTPAPEGSDEPGERAAGALKRALFGLLRHTFGKPVQVGAETVAAMDPGTLAAAVRGNMLNEAGRRAVADLIEKRAGKVLSADNETHLRTACDHMRQATEHVSAVVDAANSDDEADEDTDGGTAEERAVAATATAVETRRRAAVAAMARAQAEADLHA